VEKLIDAHDKSCMVDEHLSQMTQMLVHHTVKFYKNYNSVYLLVVLTLICVLG